MIIYGFWLAGSAPTRAGRHKLAGTVTVDGLPARRNITVFDRRNFSWVASTTSDPVTGAWEIPGVTEYPERSLLVVATDITGNYNAEVADYITQVATYVPPTGDPWTHDAIAKLLWLDASDAASMTLNVDRVSQWADKSGNARHAVQADTAKQPLWSLTGVSFVETDELLAITNPAKTTQSMFIAYEPSTSKTQHLLLGDGGTANYALCDQSGSTNPISSYTGAAYYINGYPSPEGNRGAVYTAVNGKISVVEIIGTNLSAWEGLALSGYNDPTWAFIGKVKEIIIIDGTSDLETRQLFTGHLAWKWGAQTNLYEYHPYKGYSPIAAA